MGYNPKTTYCNLAELEKGGLSTIFGSNSFTQEKATEESLVDLTLGTLSDFGKGLSVSHSFRDHTASLMDSFSSPAGSSKRARTPSSGGQMVSCLVDGCNADLSKCRDYHRRHKVCEMHSKTPRVTIGGHEQRFCQQCSRFHSLGEFDDGKRSCRKRLEGHNRRRRKPQPEPLPMNPGNFLPASQGSRFLPFSTQPMIPPTSMVSSTWSRSIKSESNPTLLSNSVSSSFSNAYGGRQFPFMQLTESPAGQTLHHDGSSSSNNSNSQKMFCSGLNQVIDSDRALSLLSSPPADTPDMGLGRILHSSPTNAARPTLSGLHFNGFAPYASSHGHGFQGQPGSSTGFVFNLRNNNTLCQDVFPSGSDGSSTSGGHQTLSFSWE
ncbi:hypothetical protein RND81_02G248400 [Saponaria officinalis]|uniref:SBP-type domain-containing protein n=1 Tax=Saponaria officinalis TaxID=3572 RepID=A0AAW1MU59_SAPOF